MHRWSLLLFSPAAPEKRPSSLHPTTRAARRRGSNAVRLNVNKHNLKSIAAYRKHGYAVIETVVAAIGGGYVMDDYVMEKKL